MKGSTAFLIMGAISALLFHHVDDHLLRVIMGVSVPLYVSLALILYCYGK